MSDRQIFAPTYVSSLSGNAAAADMFGQVSTSQNIALAANRAVYMGLYLPVPYLIRRLFWGNGSSGNAASVDVGVYWEDGTLLVSTGGVTKGTGSVVNYYVLTTEFFLMPGQYYLGYSNNNGGVGVANGSTPAVGYARSGGVFEQDAAFPLPATMTPVVATDAVFPHVGFTST